MSTLEDLQEKVRQAVSDVDNVSDSLEEAQEELDAITLELELAVEDADEITPPEEPARVGDIVEILKSTDGVEEHVGQQATVIAVPGSMGYSIKVLLPQKSGGCLLLIQGQPIWNLKEGTYRVVARLTTFSDNSRAYDYPEVS